MSKTPKTLNFDCDGDYLSWVACYGDPDVIEVFEILTSEKVNVCGYSYCFGKVENQPWVNYRQSFVLVFGQK
ncbi:hypothetical protein K151_1926 [Proteus hauseri ZMd44]|nr:hypothetical protein K151_1926 [Proteus hauseri ZMd44]